MKKIDRINNIKKQSQDGCSINKFHAKKIEESMVIDFLKKTGQYNDLRFAMELDAVFEEVSV